jgi:hypothetical protein
VCVLGVREAPVYAFCTQPDEADQIRRFQMM